MIASRQTIVREGIIQGMGLCIGAAMVFAFGFKLSPELHLKILGLSAVGLAVANLFFVQVIQKHTDLTKFDHYTGPELEEVARYAGRRIRHIRGLWGFVFLFALIGGIAAFFIDAQLKPAPLFIGYGFITLTILNMARIAVEFTQASGWVIQQQRRQTLAKHKADVLAEMRKAPNPESSDHLERYKNVIT